MNESKGKALTSIGAIVNIIWALSAAAIFNVVVAFRGSLAPNIILLTAVVALAISVYALIKASSKHAASKIVVLSVLEFFINLITGIIGVVLAATKLLPILILVAGLVVPVILLMGAVKNRS